MNVQYQISGFGPLVFGDGRPFSNQEGSLSVEGLNLPFPSTLTGALVRPLLGDPVGGQIPGLNHFMVRGPLLALDDEAHFPLPLDGVPMARGERTFLARLRPGCSPADSDAPSELEKLPTVNLEALEAAGYERKKSVAVAWVPFSALKDWLVDNGNGVLPCPMPATIPRERRIGVGIDYETQSAERGRLYSTTGVYYTRSLSKTEDPVRRHPRDVALRVMVSLPNDSNPPNIATFPFGGEKRYAVAKRLDISEPFHCPEEIRSALGETQRIKLVLATPAQFECGWLPAWLAQGGECPNTALKFRLVSACVGRRVAVSGWGQGKNFGPKPATWLAPAGSVYFLELVDPPADYADRLANAWLKAVSDDSRFRRRGFGLALWGTWREAEEQQES